MIVADSNLIAYLLIRSEQTPAAEAVLRKDASWAAPLLWRSEFRNVLALYLRRGHLTLADALQYMQEAEALLEDREYQVPSAPVLELSQRSGCTACDCEFVHLARELGVPLVTSDQRLLHAFPEVAVDPRDFAARSALPEP
ncbi:MAG TPA: type II toxin-antitoxin system VapC family toxin [Armatimonadota bacterium]|nr:type II toxin-antitoxin system VapC family toxin [Armatimonadota bacterium]